ncbi:MAG: 6-phosphofructokinase, partial [Candidatus Magnetoglobus multicellularis str. Araruama]
QRGGTKIGTARCKAFETRDGRRQAARNLLNLEITNLVVIGGDGSLTGANVFCQEWPELIQELLNAGDISNEIAKTCSQLKAVGLPASIDNDLYGSDMSIGTDTALHRITEAVDAISTTAASHQRTFVIEVMGRNCGYLALMGALASGADWVFIPEMPPPYEDWEEKMCSVLKTGRDSGRRDTIVIVAEGAIDRHGNTIHSSHVKNILEERLNEDVRVTILGHVQRGGAPSAYDRILGTFLGYSAVESLISKKSQNETLLIGMRGNNAKPAPLMECVNISHSVAESISKGDYDKAMQLRGNVFVDTYNSLYTLMKAREPSISNDLSQSNQSLRIAIMNCDAAAPGMNTAVRSAIRLGIDHGHTFLGIEHGFRGFIDGKIRKLDWFSVRGWATIGGAELGTSRKIPKGGEFYAIARHIEHHEIDAIIIIGGWSGYQTAYNFYQQRESYPAFKIPILCIPASIDNNLPGSEYSIGCDTAINNIIEAVDKIKQSAVATNRCIVVEVMGYYCGYLALMSGIATGAERVYLHEEGVTLKHLQKDLSYLKGSFQQGKRLGLIICNEKAHPVYNTNFIRDLLTAEGKKLFTVRRSILGHLQQGGDPTPMDRINATRLAIQGIKYLIDHARKEHPFAKFMGLKDGNVNFWDLSKFYDWTEKEYSRAKEKWWWNLRKIASILAQPAPHAL